MDLEPARLCSLLLLLLLLSLLIVPIARSRLAAYQLERQYSAGYLLVHGGRAETAGTLQVPGAHASYPPPGSVKLVSQR